MLKRLFPHQYLQSIFELNIEALKAEGIKGVIFDIDNTLVPYDIPEPTNEIIALFEKLKASGFGVALVSNNTEDRVLKFNEKLKVFALHKSKKPGTRSFKRAMELMKLTKDEVIVVGDQIFTDVYGGNKAGLKTVLVVPVSDNDEWVTKVKRGLEKQVIKRYEKNNNARKGKL